MRSEVVSGSVILWIVGFGENVFCVCCCVSIECKIVCCEWFRVCECVYGRE